MLTTRDVAIICYTANAAYARSIGDHSFPPVEEAPDWMIDTNVKGVEFALKNPNATPEMMHQSWVAEKIATGWVYGPEKNPEAVPPTHPCIKPYEELPLEQRIKDAVFRNLVEALRLMVVSD